MQKIGHPSRRGLPLTSVVYFWPGLASTYTYFKLSSLIASLQLGTLPTLTTLGKLARIPQPSTLSAQSLIAKYLKLLYDKWIRYLK